MLSVLVLCWAVLTLRTTATRHHQKPTSLSSDHETLRWLEGRTYSIRNKGDRAAQEPVDRGSEGNVDYWKDQYKDCFLILNVKSHAYLCLDSKGKLYTSVFAINKDCRFRRVKRHKHYDIFRSCRGHVPLANPRQIKRNAHNLTKLSGFIFLKPHKHRTHHRKMRSLHTDPSDPLGSEYPGLGTMRSWRSDPEYGGNISKETITSIDDPLEVLLSHSAQTPTLGKHRVNRKFRF